MKRCSQQREKKSTRWTCTIEELLAKKSFYFSLLHWRNMQQALIKEACHVVFTYMLNLLSFVLDLTHHFSPCHYYSNIEGNFLYLKMIIIDVAVVVSTVGWHSHLSGSFLCLFRKKLEFYYDYHNMAMTFVKKEELFNIKKMNCMVILEGFMVFAYSYMAFT